MARKPRVEIEGGLYHVVTRGNNRQVIFNSKDDYLKMLALLEHRKRKPPFRLYAYCLMPNHIHSFDRAPKRFDQQDHPASADRL